MNKIALGTLALGLSLAAPSAFAQTQPCPAGSWLCADITIGGGPAQPPPVVVSPPPPVYMTPPPRVIVLPPRPRVYYMPPPPRVVLVPPPPMVLYQPAPQYYQQQQGYYLPPPRPRGYVGLQASVGGVYMSSTASGGGAFIGGVNAGLRFRSAGHLGAELAVGVYSGTDYNGDGRTEVPVSFTGLFYFNPQNRLQVYGLLGLGASFADVTYAANNQAQHNYMTGANYAYLGGSAGLGLELQLSPRLAVFADVRGFVRARVDGDTSTNPEFTRVTTSGATETTNTSAGALGQLGLILYF